MSEKLLANAIIYCDGACSGNPGPGGWGTIVATPEGEVVELGGGNNRTTNNQMELQAATEGLNALGAWEGDVVIYTDSVYVINGITKWIWGWIRNGWKTGEGKEVLNKDYWQDLSSAVAKRKKHGAIAWKYTRGHTGIPGNERCDEIAVAFSKAQPIRLYRGSLAEYHFDLRKLPAEEAIPESNFKKGPKAGPYSYLSLLGATALRHKTWPDCERRVKGQPGAKYKKAMTAEEEETILRSWGIDPKSVRDN